MSEARRFWSQHLAAIEAEGITTKAYAEREKLSVTALYQWRRRLNVEAAGSQGVAQRDVEASRHWLVPVRLTTSRPERCVLAFTPSLQLELAGLPDPQWLAEVAAAMQVVR
jgi:hypothetical protein